MQDRDSTVVDSVEIRKTLNVLLQSNDAEKLLQIIRKHFGDIYKLICTKFRKNSHVG